MHRVATRHKRRVAHSWPHPPTTLSDAGCARRSAAARQPGVRVRMRDPYEMLGVPRDASAADIKSAFRRLAKKLHPDANKHDPKAAARFAELNAAYEIVGDENKRKAFDRGEIDAEGKPRFQGFEGFGARPGARFRARRALRDLQLRSRRRARRAGRRRRRLRRFRRHPARTCSAVARAAGGGRRAVRNRRFRRAPAARSALPRPPSRSPKRPRARSGASICRPARRSRSKFRPALPTASRSG